MEFPANTNISGRVDNIEHLSISCPPRDSDRVGQSSVLSPSAGVLPDWFVAISASGSAKRLVQLLVAIDADPDSALGRDGDRVVVGRADLRRRSIADRCGVRSEGTVGEWLDRWRARGWLVDGGQFDLAAFGAAHGVEAVGGPDSGVEVPAAGSASGATDTAVLSVLLERLERAHVSKLDSLASDLTGLIERVLDVAEHNNHSPRVERVSAVDARVNAVSSREVVSEVFDYSNSTTYLTTQDDESADRVRGERPADEPRLREDFLELVAPLTKLVSDRSLTGMRRSGGVEAALRPYSDAQVVDAVRAVCRMVRADNSIRSPFGLLVSFARDGNPDVFGASVELVEPMVPPVRLDSDLVGERVDPSIHLDALRSQLRTRSSETP